MIAQQQRVDRLEEEVERLRQHIKAMTPQPALRLKFPSTWRVTGHEAHILHELLRGGWVSKDRLMAVLPEIGARDRAVTTIYFYIKCLREKMKPLGVSIEMTYGVGYRIAPEHKEIIRAAMAVN